MRGNPVYCIFVINIKPGMIMPGFLCYCIDRTYSPSGSTLYARPLLFVIS